MSWADGDPLESGQLVQWNVEVQVELGLDQEFATTLCQMMVVRIVLEKPLKLTLVMPAKNVVPNSILVARGTIKTDLLSVESDSTVMLANARHLLCLVGTASLLFSTSLNVSRLLMLRTHIRSLKEKITASTVKEKTRPTTCTGSNVLESNLGARSNSYFSKVTN